MSIHLHRRPKSSNANAAFGPDQEPIASPTQRRPVRYTGGLYERRRGTLAYVVAERRDRVPAPLVVEWPDGARGIAERSEIEVLR